MKSPEILYLDREMIVAVKPSGLLSQGDAAGDPDILVLLSAELRRRREPDTIYPIHRLDRGVGGVMVFARTSEAASRLSLQLSDPEHAHKEYLAICHGVPNPLSGEMLDTLFHDERKRRTEVVPPSHPKGKPARLAYRLIKETEHAGKSYSLLWIRLYTGRTHQIRAQLSSRGLPLAGDGRYGGKDRFPSIALFAYRLSLSHPKDGRRLTFTALPEADLPFSLFTDEISELNERSNP